MKFFSRSLSVTFFLLALGLRAIVPVGYMPDFSGHAEGVFSVVLCDGVDHAGHAGHHHHGTGGHDSPCPFSFGTAFTPAALTPPPAAPLLFGEALTPPAVTASPARAAIFSNSSPRSPPSFS